MVDALAYWGFLEHAWCAELWHSVRGQWSGTKPAFWSTGTRGNIWRICEEGRAPVAGDQVVDEDQHLELGQLVARAGVHAVPEWQEGVRPRRHLQSQTTRGGELVSSANCTRILLLF